MSFRIGADDAEMLEKEFTPTFLAEDIVNIPKFHVYLKLMIDGMASQPFSAAALAPIAARSNSTAEVISETRKVYGTPRAKVEEYIHVWSLGDAPEDYAPPAPPPAAPVEVEAHHDDGHGHAAVHHHAPAAHVVTAAPAVAATTAPIIQPTTPVAAPAPAKKERENKLPPPSEWFPTKCDRCGTDTAVPFPPDGKRRIYCKDCYKFRHEDEAALAAKPADAKPEVVATQTAPPVPPVVATTTTPSDEAPKKRRRRH
ncbi:MAG: hypothetical protein NT003_01195 [Candidatus Magasanikbacteria bacterium]|nr:hypothetical protein [Candidatus Magasanikbacteria bacterium]